jgi:hypothetical protein
VDADIRGFFDSVNHGLLQQILRQRVNDGGIVRLVGKWLKAGIQEGGSVTRPETGTPQGGVISPLLSNIFLHTVLDEWFVEQVQPRLRGRSFLIRFADDFVIGCEFEDDARRVESACEASGQVRPEPSSGQDPAGAVPAAVAGSARVGRERHIRLSRIHPLLGPLPPGILGDQAPHRPQEAAAVDAGDLAVVPEVPS